MSVLNELELIDLELNYLIEIFFLIDKTAWLYV